MKKICILAIYSVFIISGLALANRGYEMSLSEPRRIAVIRILTDLTTDLNTTEGLSSLGYDAVLTLVEEFWGPSARQNLESCVIENPLNNTFFIPVEQLEKFNDWRGGLSDPQ